MSRRSDGGQANLPALAVALVVLSAAAGFSLAVADGAFASEARQPADRYAAVAVAERLVSPDGQLAVRPNVLRRSETVGLTAATLDRAYPVARGHDLRVRLGGRTHIERGDPAGGATVRRIVLVANRQTVTRRPPLGGGAVTVPRRTDRVRLSIEPPAGTTVETVRANRRVVLRNASGLSGTFDVRVSRFETVRLTFETSGPLPRGSVVLTYYPERTTKAVLAVTVDA